MLFSFIANLSRRDVFFDVTHRDIDLRSTGPSKTLVGRKSHKFSSADRFSKKKNIKCAVYLYLVARMI